MLYILLIILIGVIASKKLRLFVRYLIEGTPGVILALLMLALICAIVGLVAFGIIIGVKTFATRHPYIFALTIDLILFGLFCLLMQFLENKFWKKKDKSTLPPN